MLILTHLLFGLFLGKLLGSVLLVAIGSIIVDIDHLYVFVKRGLIFYPRKLWASMFSPHDPYGTHRTVAHSFFAWLVVTIAVTLVNKQYGAMISIGYLGHLMLDAIDSDDLQLMFPLKGTMKGPVVYNSRVEYFIDIIIVAVLFVFFYLM
jgi:membrane-bound metal-dependent hydrolase YbcI (DUF457 family)